METGDKNHDDFSLYGNEFRDENAVYFGDDLNGACKLAMT